jgi:hypothetical protein
MWSRRPASAPDGTGSTSGAGKNGEGHAESVSALIAQGLELLAARAQLEAVVTGLHSEVGELD